MIRITQRSVIVCVTAIACVVALSTISHALWLRGLPQPSAGGEVPFGGTPWLITSAVQAENYDLGGNGVAYSVAGTCGITPDTAYRADDVNTSAGATGRRQGCILQGDYYKYTVNIPSTGNYTFTMNVANVIAGAVYEIDMDGVFVATITAPNTGSYDTFQSVASSSAALVSGTHIMKIICSNAPGNGYCGDFDYTVGSPVGTQTFLSASLPSNSFVAQAGNANATIGTVSIALSPSSPPFSGMCTGLGGADAALFTVTSACVVKVGASDVTTVRSYAVTVTGTQSSPPVTPSPFTSSSIAINGVAPGNSVAVTVASGAVQTFEGAGFSVLPIDWNAMPAPVRTSLAGSLFGPGQFNSMRIWTEPPDQMVLDAIPAGLNFILVRSHPCDGAFAASNDAANSAAHWISLGVAGAGVSVGNKPNADNQNPCSIIPASQIAQHVSAIRSELNNRGLPNVLSSGPDTVEWAPTTPAELADYGFSPGDDINYMNAIVNDATALASIGAFATQTYGKGVTTQMQNIASSHGKKYWVSMATPPYNKISPDSIVSNAVNVAQFLNDLNHGANKWFLWTWAWLCNVEALPQTVGEITFSTAYYHITNLLGIFDPGAQVRAASASPGEDMHFNYGSEPQIIVAAAKNPDNSWAIGLVNLTGVHSNLFAASYESGAAHDVTVTISVPELSSTPSLTFARKTITSATPNTVNGANAVMTNGQLTVTVSSLDTVTLVSRGVGAPTISGIALSSGTSFNTPANAGSTLGTLSATCTGGSCAGATFALSTSASGCNGTNGAQNGSFAISGTNLNVGGSTINGTVTEHVCMAVTLAGATNNGAGFPLTLNGGPTTGTVFGVSMTNGPPNLPNAAPGSCTPTTCTWIQAGVANQPITDVYADLTPMSTHNTTVCPMLSDTTHFSISCSSDGTRLVGHISTTASPPADGAPLTVTYTGFTGNNSVTTTIHAVSGTVVACGDSNGIQNAVNAAGAGATLIFQACTYDWVSNVLPQNNQTFIGIPGQTIFDGGGNRVIGNRAMIYGHDDNITGVTIANITMQHWGDSFSSPDLCLPFYPPAPCGFVGYFMDTNDGWTLRNMKMDSTFQTLSSRWHTGTVNIINNVILHAGSGAIGSGDSSSAGTINVIGNEMGFVNTIPAGSCADSGNKFLTHGFHYNDRNNYYHDFNGPVIWMDSYDNQVYDIQNSTFNRIGTDGVYLEQQHTETATIAFNVFNNNGDGSMRTAYSPDCGGEAQEWQAIRLDGAANANIHDNNFSAKFVTKPGSIFLWQDESGNCTPQPPTIARCSGQNNSFHDNTVSFFTNNGLAAVGWKNTPFDVSGNSLNNNHYHLVGGNISTDAHWYFFNQGDTAQTFNNYRASGQDANSTIDTIDKSMPGCTHVACSGSGVGAGGVPLQ